MAAKNLRDRDEVFGKYKGNPLLERLHRHIVSLDVF